MLGRATETACIRLSDMSLESPPEFGIDENRLKQILSVKLQRHKTANSDVQSIAIFPACSSLFQDFYFSLAYHFVMIDGIPSSAYLFPEYASKANADKERVQSKVPVFFGNMVDEITKSASNLFESVSSSSTTSTYAKLAEGINKGINISSHSNRRFSVESLTSFPGLPIPAISFRAGWMMKNVHTLFDYISPRDSDDRKVGRAAAGWSTGGDKVGVPPSLLIAGIDAIKARSFVNNLFYAWEDREELTIELKFLFAGSIMRHLFDFERIVLDHPAGSFDDPWQDHTFLRRILAAAKEAGWSKEDLKKASNCVIQEFLNQNVLGVPVQSLHQWASEDNAVTMQVDARTVTSHMEDSLRLMASIQQTQMQHSAGINAMRNSIGDIQKMYEDLRDDIKTLRDENKSLRDENKSLRDENRWLRDEMRMMNATITDTAIEPTNVHAVAEIPTNISSGDNELIKDKRMCIDAVVKYWYQYDYANVYQRYVDNPDAKISSSEKSVMSDFARIVSVVNLFLESHIEKTEDGRFSNEAIRIRKDMFDAVNRAVDMMMELFGESGVLDGKGKTKLTTGNFVKKVREWVKDGKVVLPQGPPGVCLYDTTIQAKKKIMTYDQLMASFKAKMTRGTRVTRGDLDAAFGRAFESV